MLGESQSQPSSQLGDAIKQAITAEVSAAEEEAIQSDLEPFRPDGIQAGIEKQMRDMFQIGDQYAHDQEPMKSQLRVISSHLFGEQGIRDPQDAVSRIVKLLWDARIKSNEPANILKELSEYISKNRDMSSRVNAMRFYAKTGLR